MFILVCLHFKNEKRKDDKFSHGNKEISENYYEVKNYATISKKLGKTKRMRKYINFADFLSLIIIYFIQICCHGITTGKDRREVFGYSLC